MLKTGKISSREGSVVLYDDLIKEGVERAEKEIKSRGVGELKNARGIAMAAIKYAMLSRDNSRTILFDWDHVLNFEGDSGPYLQYTYARASSILKKSKKKPLLKGVDKKLSKIIKKLAQFPDIVTISSDEMKPHYIANYLTELAALFNEFYHAQRVIGSEDEESLLAVVNAVKNVMANGLRLLGIKALEKM
jgi:arginyl-tRNA synthetase